MKKIVLLIMISTLSLFALGEEIHDFKYETSYYQALKKAKQQHKILLVMIAKKGCPACAYMKDIVFERPQILDYLNRHYVVAILDIYKRNYPKQFISHRAPTFFFLDPFTTKELYPSKTGSSRPAHFIQELTVTQTAFENNTTVPWDWEAEEEKAPLSTKNTR